MPTTASHRSFALQRRILLSYEQIPQVLKDASSRPKISTLNSIGRGLYAGGGRGLANLLAHRVAEGASTLTMQLAARCFSTAPIAPCAARFRKLCCPPDERHYTKQQIFTMYCNQIYLSHGNYGFEAASEYYFGKRWASLRCRAALLAA